MVTLSDIKTINWQLSTAKQGDVVQGIDDIKQCITIIVTTQKGSDPLRPDFGIDIMSYIDLPMSVVVPKLTNEILVQVAKYEPRCKITSFNRSVDISSLTITINFTLSDAIGAGQVVIPLNITS